MGRSLAYVCFILALPALVGTTTLPASCFWWVQLTDMSL